MKVVHITTTDYGGAYRAASNISIAMRKQGIESVLLVREKSGSESVVPAVNTRLAFLRSKMRNFFNLLISHGDVVNDRFGYAIQRHFLVKEADVIVLHWVNSFVSYRGVERLLRSGKPVIWVLHDMWLMTGGCHYDKECGKYRGECRDCPLLRNRVSFTCRLQKRKKKMLAYGNFTAVGCSQWITECARTSMILSTKQCICIPNPVDTELYSKKKLKTLINKKTILFGAMHITDERKGMDLLIKALHYLPREQYTLAIVGEADQKIWEGLEFEYHFYGKIDSQERMAEIYNEADVYVIPSRQENLSNSVIEAMACGIPVVAFNIGGMPDLIVHKRNGYLVSLQDSRGLAEGIIYCTENGNELGQYAYEYVRKNYSYEVIGVQYRYLCEKLEKENRDGR